jgi:hypothetical protein
VNAVCTSLLDFGYLLGQKTKVGGKERRENFDGRRLHTNTSLNSRVKVLVERKAVCGIMFVSMKIIPA